MIILFIFLMCGLTGCSDFAHSSVQTVVTRDCGVSWEVIKPGLAIPKAGLNYCFKTVTIPDYPMQGDTEFRVNFKNKAFGRVKIDYDYNISEPIAFLSEAKYVGNQSTSADKKANDSGFEAAENGVIDKRIKEIVKGLTPEHDIVDFDPSAFEDEILPKINELTSQKGVKLNFLTFTLFTDTQTNQAIDSASAMRIYKANDLEELGKELMKSRAGATQINVDADSENKK